MVGCSTRMLMDVGASASVDSCARMKGHGKAPSNLTLMKSALMPGVDTAGCHSELRCESYRGKERDVWGCVDNRPAWFCCTI